MFRKFKLATVIAIAISAGGTMGSVYAGGHGNGGRSSGGFSGGGYKVGGSGGGGSAPRIHQSGSTNVIRSGNFGGIKLGGSSSNSGNSGMKTTPKNTGIVPPVVRIGGSSSGTGIKLPGVGSGNNSNKPNLGNVISGNVLKNSSVINSSNGLKNLSDKMKSPSVQSKGLGGLGINVGGSSNNSHNHHGHHDHHHHGNGHHHGHHHHFCPPLVFTLPVCQPNYCPPPCPPIYYPVAVPVPVPVSDPNAVGPVDPNAVPAAPPMGLPMETQKALEEAVSKEAPAAESEVKPAAATTEVVNKDVQLPQIPVGATLTLNGKDLTEKEGQVVLQLGEIALPATIKEWKNDSVTCTLPVLGLTKPSKATLHVLKADGKTASTLNCELVTTLPTSVEAKPANTTDIEAAKYEQ